MSKLKEAIRPYLKECPNHIKKELMETLDGIQNKKFKLKLKEQHVPEFTVEAQEYLASFKLTAKELEGAYFFFSEEFLDNDTFDHIQITFTELGCHKTIIIFEGGLTLDMVELLEVTDV